MSESQIVSKVWQPNCHHKIAGNISATQKVIQSYTTSTSYNKHDNQNQVVRLYLNGLGYLCQNAETTCSQAFLMSVSFEKYLTIVLSSTCRRVRVQGYDNPHGVKTMKGRLRVWNWLHPNIWRTAVGGNTRRWRHLPTTNHNSQTSQ